MVNLWRTIAFLAARPEVMKACVDAVGNNAFETIKRAPPDRRLQPTQQAITALDGVLNKGNGQRLGLYELAEINRWLQTPNLRPLLDAYQKSLKLNNSSTPPMLEVAGVLLMDREFRTDVASSGAPGQLLRDNGFTITDDEAKGVQLAVKDNATQNTAENFFKLLWSGSLCHARLKLYGVYSHPNI